MINLLNPQDLEQLRAARVNVRLRKYALATLLAIGVVAGIYAVGLKIADDQYAQAQTDNSSAEQQLAGFDTVKKEATTYQSNLIIAKKILGGEIVFSDFMTDVAKTLPPNTILSSLSLTTKSVQSAQKKAGSTQLNARAKSYNDILALKTKLEDSTLFSDVRIAQTTIPDSLVGKTGVELTYPYEVTFDLVINQLGGIKE